MKRLMLAVMTLTFVFMFAGSSMAALSWDTCGIDRIGVEGTDANLLKVKDCGVSGNNGKWLALVQQKDVAMATLLTAVAMNEKVKLSADFANADTSGGLRGAVDVIYLDPAN